ncbi:MAG: NifB/NifX family molybdenum-iron cluster-binding protein [Promethearchaeota archaeon]|jgi:predicted Fe-Mo cluster-binding NifX family protein
MITIGLPSKGNGGLNESIEERFGKCESITLVSLKNNNIDAVKTFLIQSNEVIGNMGTNIASLVINNKVSIVLVQYIGSKAFKLLKSQDIKIFQIVKDKLAIKECIKLYLQDKLTILKQPNSHLFEE